MRNGRETGFTLIELMVVILIIGILAAFGVPQYLKSVESTKAEDAAATLRMVGTTNRMFYLDHSAVYASGMLDTAGTGCPSPPGCPTSAPYGACALVACRYLSGQDWDRKPYEFRAMDGTATSSGCGRSFPASRNYVACAARKTSGVGSTSLSPYVTWGYAIDANGVLEKAATSAPDPVQ